MSAALDTMTTEEQKLLDQMRTDDASTDAPLPAPTPSPAPATPATPATQQEPDETAPPDQPQTSVVSQQALHAEREKRKAAEAREREKDARYAAELARVQERLALLTQAATAATAAPAPAPAAPQPPPDPQADPLGYVQHVTAETQRTISALEQRVARSEGLERQITEAQLQQAREADLRAWGWGQEAEFAQETPDYKDAMQFLTTRRAAQLNVMGINNPAQVQAMIGNDVAAMAMRAREGGLQFGKMLYELARETGYQKAAQAPLAPTLTPAPITGAAAPTPAQRVATAQRGAEMAAGIGAGGTAPRGELTPQALADMSDEQFAEVLAKMGPKGLPSMFGE